MIAHKENGAEAAPLPLLINLHGEVANASQIALKAGKTAATATMKHRTDPRPANLANLTGLKRPPSRRQPQPAVNTAVVLAVESVSLEGVPRCHLKVPRGGNIASVHRLRDSLLLPNGIVHGVVPPAQTP